MRMLVFFDLPRDSYKQRKAATDFAKTLIKEGFIMLQESVYCKLALNAVTVGLAKERLEKIKPNTGSIMLLTVTEKQFNDMDIIIGELSCNTISNVERVVIL